MAFRRSLRDLLARFGTPSEAPASEVREAPDAEPGPQRIGDARARTVVRVRGRIDTLNVRPRGSSPWLEAAVSDGSGTINVIWMGRREVPGIHAGRTIMVSGRLADADGVLTLYNPRYELL